MKGLLVDQSSGALILEAAVHLLDLHGGEPEEYDVFGELPVDILPRSLTQARYVARPVSLGQLQVQVAGLWVL